MINKECLASKSVKGIVKFVRSTKDDCVCCKGNHIFTRNIEFEDWGSKAPNFFPRDANLFVREVAMDDEFEGCEVRITVEVLDNSENKYTSELEDKIEKMKCCGNCKNSQFEIGSCCNRLGITCINKSEWESNEQIS